MVIRHRADVLAFQLGAGQLLAAAAVVDVDAAAVVLVVVAAVAVAAGIVNAAFAANIVGFHLEIVAGGQRARQLTPLPCAVLMMLMRPACMLPR